MGGMGGGGGAASPAPLLCYNMYFVAYGKCGNYHFECCCFLQIVIKNKGKARNVYSGIRLVYSLNNRDLNVIMATLLFPSNKHRYTSLWQKMIISQTKSPSPSAAVHKC